MIYRLWYGFSHSRFSMETFGIFTRIVLFKNIYFPFYKYRYVVRARVREKKSEINQKFLHVLVKRMTYKFDGKQVAQQIHCIKFIICLLKWFVLDVGASGCRARNIIYGIKKIPVFWCDDVIEC